ncbi:MAG: hypothetical protein ACYC4T_10475 [Melioribacteraceae bacterium]
MLNEVKSRSAGLSETARPDLSGKSRYAGKKFTTLTSRFLIIVGLLFVYSYNAHAQCAGWGLGSHERSGSHSYINPATAALLSLQPLPIAVGNFYTGDWGRGTLYTAVELALFIPGMILVIDNSDWGHRRANVYYNTSYSNSNWTKAERDRFYYLLAGYVVVKIISAFDAGYSAEWHNTNYALQYDEQSKSLALAFRYSF